MPLTDLYNHYVRETAITFDTEPFTPERRLPWLRSYPEDGPYRLLVAQDVQIGTEGRILVYATSGAFHPEPAYSTSVEVSVHLSPDAAGRGIGTLLYRAALRGPRDRGRPPLVTRVTLATMSPGRRPAREAR